MSAFHPLLCGAVELHCHSFPSIFPRRQTDWELIEDVKSAGMAGFILKSHEAPTTDRAAILREKEPNLHIYGGLVCNAFVGGLSPFAVDVAIRSGAKIIWMPTVSSREHRNHFHNKNTRFFTSNRPLLHPVEGIEIWDQDHKIKPEVYEILALIAEGDIVLATGHITPPETVELLKAAKTMKVNKVLVQHVDLGIARVPLELQSDFARQGAILEKCYLACGEDFQDLTLADMADSMKRLGPESCVMVTDFGQAHNVPVVQALSDFVGHMLDHGITGKEIETMLIRNPKALIGME